MIGTIPSVEALFVGKAPIVREIYARLLAILQGLDPFHEGPKKTSLHLA